MSNRVKRVQPSRAVQRRRAAARRRTAWRWGTVAAAVVAIVAVVVGVLAFGGSDSSDTSEEIAFNGVALPGLTDGPDPAVGIKAPIFVTADLLSGGRVVVGGGGGPNDTAKVILFAAHWCPACRQEVPVVAEWLDQGGLPDGVEMVAVSTLVDPQRDNYPPEAWFTSVDWPHPVMEDDGSGSILAMFGLTSVPSWVVLDNENHVVTRATGALGAQGLDALVALAAGD